jgi:predicted phosphohydrolase
MSIWAIADIHASRTDPDTGRPVKPMDIFGSQWHDHVQRLESAWFEVVGQADTVIVAGDIDWALYLEDARETLQRIDSWPGHKIILRGNHDYWWSSKATNKVRKVLPASLSLLHNNSFRVEGFNICGAKGSPVPGAIDWSAENARMLNREEQRLLLSLQARDPELPTIAALHFPPFYPSQAPSPYQSLFESHGVSLGLYGHLHGEAIGSGPVGDHRGVEYLLVSGDAVGFRPVLVARDGQLTLSSRPDISDTQVP